VIAAQSARLVRDTIAHLIGSGMGSAGGGTATEKGCEVGGDIGPQRAVGHGVGSEVETERCLSESNNGWALGGEC
jgi:hypothetical protein